MFKKGKADNSKRNILSNAYFSVNSKLRDLNYNVYAPGWRLTRDKSMLYDPGIFTKSEKIRTTLRVINFGDIFSGDFNKLIEEYRDELSIYFSKNKISALFVPNDLSFFENLSIKVCKQLKIPTFIFIHGLPGRYNSIDDNRGDYLIVWGNKIKENYIRAGVDPGKIFVSGHPYYKSIENRFIKFSTDNILVVTKSMNGAPPCSNEIYLSDRGNLLLYLFSIENVLKKFGVKSVRFRPHPSENPDWYSKYLNNNFYKLDTNNLHDSIQNSSLVIGPTSTLFLESIYYGVNYVIYEPSVNNIDVMNYPLVSPFEGNDVRIPVAKSEEELSYLMEKKQSVDPAVFAEFIKSPFDISFVQNLI
jgi:hypothetical protein